VLRQLPENPFLSTMGISSPACAMDINTDVDIGNEI
jgi:hypothetical protein